MPQGQFRRTRQDPNNPGIIYLESEDGREVPVTSELADMLAPMEQEQRLGGLGASEPLAQHQPSTGGGRIRQRYVPLEEQTVEGRDFPTQEVDNTNQALQEGGMPNPTVGLQQAQQRQADMDAGRFLRPTERDLALDQANAEAAAPAPSTLPTAQGVVPPAPPEQVAGQGEQAGLGRLPLPVEVANADLNANGIPDLFEHQGGGGGMRVQQEMTTTQRAPISPGTLDELGYRSNVERDANRTLADTVSEGLAEVTDLEGDAQRRIAEHDRESNRMRDEAAHKVTSMGLARQEAAQRLMTGRVDPDRYLSSRGTWGRVGAAISMTLRDVAGIYAGRDLGPSLIMREIDRDIAAQQNNLDQAAREFESGGQLLQEMRQVYSDETAARLGARATLIEDAIRRVRVATLQNANAEVRQRGMVIEAQLQRELAQTMATLEQNAFTRTITETRRGTVGGGGNRGPMVDPRNLGAYSTAYTASQPRRGSEGEGPTSPPVGLRIGSTAGQQAWDSQSNATRGAFFVNEQRYRRVSRDMARLRDLVGNASSISPADRAEAEVLVSGILPQLNQYASGTSNALQGAEIDLLSNIARDPTALWSQTESTRRALDTAMNTLSGWADADRSVYDLRPDTTDLDAARSRAGGN